MSTGLVVYVFNHHTEDILVRSLLNRFLHRLGRKKPPIDNPAPHPAPTSEPAPVPEKEKPQAAQQQAPLRSAETEAWDLSRFQVEPVEGKTRFHDFDLPAEIMHAIDDLGFQYCTPIQAEILPHVLQGRDAFGKAQTGTGKSAAFLINILSSLLRHPATQGRKTGCPRALILAPTRELVVQIHKDAEDLNKYCSLRVLPVFGGIDYDKQRKQLRQGPLDVLIATPGRLLDYARQKVVRLNEVEILVIDEADRLLDMGFIPDVRNIINQTPHKDKRQTMLFSATLTPQISDLAGQWTREPVTIEIEPEQVAAESVEQIVYLATAKEKFPVLYNLITQKQLERVIVFCNRRDVTRRVRDKLQEHGISCALLSGEVPQERRMKTLENFKHGKIRVLVATDVAGRGLHIEGISHVINYNLPQDAEDYVHRIGRTGRAGATGTSVSFADEEESFYLPAIQEYMGQSLSCVYPEQELLNPLPPPKKKKSGQRSPGRRPPTKQGAGRNRSGRPGRSKRPGSSRPPRGKSGRPPKG